MLRAPGWGSALGVTARAADDFRSGDDLAGVPLGVLGGMKQQSPDRWTAGPPGQRGRGSSSVSTRVVRTCCNAASIAARAACSRTVRLVVPPSGTLLTVERRPLCLAEAFASRGAVSSRSRLPREMLQVKSN